MCGREFKRFRCVGRAKLVIENKRYTLPASIVDVGAGGFRIQSSYAMPVNEQVDFQLDHPPSSSVLVGTGVIRHARIADAQGVLLCTYGVSFVEVRWPAIKSFLTRVFGVRPRHSLSAQQRGDLGAALKAAPVFILAGLIAAWIFWRSDRECITQRQRDAAVFEAMIGYLNRAE